MAAAGALITTKYDPISPPGGRRIVSRFPAGRHIVGEAPLVCLSFANRRIRSATYRRYHGRRREGGPWYRNLISEHDKARDRTRGSLMNPLLLTRKTGIIRFLFFLPSNLYRR